MPSTQQQGRSPSMTTCKDEEPGLRTVASSLFLEHVSMHLGGREEREPCRPVNGDSMCYFWQLFHKTFFLH